MDMLQRLGTLREIQRFQAAAALLMAPGFLLPLAAQNPPPKPSVQENRTTQNPTGLQIGTAAPEAGQLPAGTEEFARQGAMASARGDWASAKIAYDAMLQVAPINPLALSNLGAVEFRLGNLERAEELLRRATNIAPEISQNWVTLGLIYHRQKETFMAISALARALAEDPDDPRAHNYMGVVIREYGWRDAAEMELQKAVVLDPKYADAHFNLAVMYLESTPPLVELARRHYYAAVDYGAARDKLIEQKLPPPPVGANN